MTEQPGPRDPAERRTTDRPAKGVDVFGDLQRWFIRQTAKNMRKEIGGQVRRTLGGSRTTSDVWDTATTEIPPEVGESPECQWCPICRAARRMRDSGPGIGGQISGAGDVVASAVQDAISALDSLLTKGGGAPTRDTTARDSTARDSTAGNGPSGNGPARDSRPTDNAPQESAPSDTSATSGASADSAAASRPGAASPHSATASQPGRDRSEPDSRRDRHGLVGLQGGGDSAGAEGVAGGTPHGNGSGPAGQAADRLATAPGGEPDPWGAATNPAEADADDDADDHSDGPGHGPDDRR
ncbi:MAG TPA: hypothetical protein VNW50_22355 [Streptosporangiaceae bacterium]|nr:hypothetical protein [Streptosporangiaceae bacterium]